MTQKTQRQRSRAGAATALINTLAANHTNTEPTKLYLAGKIGKNDWRHDLVPNLRGHLWSQGPIHAERFSYVGPFFVACDHGCNHGPNTHGATGGEDSCESPLTKLDVIANNNDALSNADLVFASINAPDCYGTLCEIGWALGQGKRVVMAFAPGIDSADFWFSALQCAAVHRDVRPCCLPALIADEVQKTKAALSAQTLGRVRHD
jgi:hypothetical protein